MCKTLLQTTLIPNISVSLIWHLNLIVYLRTLVLKAGNPKDLKGGSIDEKKESLSGMLKG
jgi:hypothetical protein